MITLIIVDCQNDFITGTMATKNARNSVNEIKGFIKNHVKEIEKILFIIDWHPYNHSSFKKYGGTHPQHCVQYTPGACIEPKLLKAIQSYNINYEVDRIGEIEEICNNGPFEDIEFVQDCLGGIYYFDSIVSANSNTEFVICGAYDDLAFTVVNMLNENIIPKIFVKGVFSPTNNIQTFIEEYKLEKIS